MMPYDAFGPIRDEIGDGHGYSLARCAVKQNDRARVDQGAAKYTAISGCTPIAGGETAGHAGCARAGQRDQGQVTALGGRTACCQGSVFVA